MALGREAMEEAKRLAVDSAREAKALIVNSPAAGKELTRPERRMRAEQFVRSDEQMELEWQKLESRFTPPQDGLIPRRWLDYGVMIMKDRKTEEPDA
jgi:hypothetical protein